MLAWDVSNINRATTNTSRCCMKAGIVVHSLEHVPVRDDIEMLGEERIMCVGKDVPWMTGRYFREEIVGIADEKRWSILWHLGVEEDLRRL